MLKPETKQANRKESEMLHPTAAETQLLQNYLKDNNVPMREHNGPP